MADGRLPLVRPRLRGRVGPGSGVITTFDMVLVLAGTAPAFEVAVKAGPASDWSRLTDIVAGAEASAKITFTTPPAAKVFPGEFSMRYTTSFGAVIEDTFALGFDERKEANAGHVTLTRKALLTVASIEFV